MPNTNQTTKATELLNNFKTAMKSYEDRNTDISKNSIPAYLRGQIKSPDTKTIEDIAKKITEMKNQLETLSNNFQELNELSWKDLTNENAEEISDNFKYLYQNLYEKSVSKEFTHANFDGFGVPEICQQIEEAFEKLKFDHEKEKFKNVINAYNEMKKSYQKIKTNFEKYKPLYEKGDFPKKIEKINDIKALTSNIEENSRKYSECLKRKETIIKDLNEACKQLKEANGMRARHSAKKNYNHVLSEAANELNKINQEMDSYSKDLEKDLKSYNRTLLKCNDKEKELFKSFDPGKHAVLLEQNQYLDKIANGIQNHANQIINPKAGQNRPNQQNLHALSQRADQLKDQNNIKKDEKGKEPQNRKGKDHGAK